MSDASQLAKSVGRNGKERELKRKILLMKRIQQEIRKEMMV